MPTSNNSVKCKKESERKGVAFVPHPILKMGKYTNVLA
jgi:hypothetical protein